MQQVIYQSGKMWHPQEMIDRLTTDLETTRKDRNEALRWKNEVQTDLESSRARVAELVEALKRHGALCGELRIYFDSGIIARETDLYLLLQECAALRAAEGESK
jgi:hypothetical protein